jgi:hypothetical protein
MVPTNRQPDRRGPRGDRVLELGIAIHQARTTPPRVGGQLADLNDLHDTKIGLATANGALAEELTDEVEVFHGQPCTRHWAEPRTGTPRDCWSWRASRRTASAPTSSMRLSARFTPER